MQSSSRIEMTFWHCPQLSGAEWSIGGYLFPEDFIVGSVEGSPAYLLAQSVEIDEQPIRLGGSSMEWLKATYRPKNQVEREDVLIPVREIISYRETHEVRPNAPNR